MKTRARTAAVLAALIATGPALAACETREGPAERMGARIDDAAENIGEAMEDLTEEEDDDWWE